MPCVSASVKITTSPAIIGTSTTQLGGMAGGPREVGAVTARDAAEPTVAAVVVDERPLHGDQPVVHVVAAHLVELRRIVRGAAAVQPEPVGAGTHDDPVGMIEPRLGPAHLEDRLEDRLVIEQVAEHLLAVEEPDEALRIQPGSRGRGPTADRRRR